MKAWQIQRRAELSRQMIRPALGTLQCDIPTYMRAMQRLAFPDSREDEINAWLHRFGSRRRHTITREEIQSQVKDWVGEGVAASTVRHRMTALSTLFTELDGEDAYNPVRGLKRPKEPKPQPDPRPLESVVRVLDEMWFRTAMNNRGWCTLARALVLTYTGMRPSQLMRIKLATHFTPFVDAEVPLVVIPAGKGGRVILQPLTMDGILALRLFERVGAEGPFSTSSFYKSWHLTCEQAGVPKFKPYSLRHTFGSLARRYADLADVQELMGHTSSKTTARYAEVVPEKLVATTQAMQQAWEQARGRVAWASRQVAENTRASGT
jgi:integrase